MSKKNGGMMTTTHGDLYLAAHGRGPSADSYVGVRCSCHASDPDWAGRHAGTVTSCSACQCTVWYLKGQAVNSSMAAEPVELLCIECGAFGPVEHDCCGLRQ